MDGYRGHQMEMNITPAPWHAGKPCADLCEHTRTCSNVWADGGLDVTSPCAGLSDADATFIAMARNAFAGDAAALAWWEENRTK
jgi:hypothetical protein